MSLSKAELKALRVEVDAALAEVGNKLGFKLTLGNTRFDPELGTFTTKISGSKNNGSSPDSPEEEFDKNVAMFNRAKYGSAARITENVFGKKFIDNGTVFKIVSCKPNAKQYPIIGQNARGTCYKFGVNVTHDAK